ncbi:hypothetical protein E6C70_08310 [Glaciibacter flavus]|uniref:Tetracyclin repressor-like C-terminal domain-containing protein n=2 Tax=Orlajensenia flava TaxID=2565934 RepID=A0A4S4FUX9_9MICO|nr:TetR-like C-terminal domain-containing protein [Glaciibacter flavus]THG34284.1 hypothetical protein E6C70_08310 [Glaciibacter flavus]
MPRDRQRVPLIPLVGLSRGAYFANAGTTFADLRRDVLGDRPSSDMDVILARGVERGEIDPARITPRISSLPFDLFRHELLMTLQAVPDETIEEFVDEIFLPLVEPR